MTKPNDLKKIVVTGGAGYVGSILVPFLVKRDYEVTVLDLLIYGDHVFPSIKDNKNFRLIKGDIRDTALCKKLFKDQDVLIHLACISNDPSFDLNPELGKSINLDSFYGLVEAVKESSIKRFIYASSSSVYGLRSEPAVTEKTPCTPLTDYSKFKLKCEEILEKSNLTNCDYSIIRPATVCGYAPRLRLDLTVNILTTHAVVNRKMRVFGGNQLRPHVYIHDMVEAYRLLLESSSEKIASKIFNAGYENRSVLKTAELIQAELGRLGVNNIDIQVEKSDDHRSYHIDSNKIYKDLGFQPKYTLSDAVSSLYEAFEAGKISNPMDNTLYYNIKRMNELNLT